MSTFGVTDSGEVEFGECENFTLGGGLSIINISGQRKKDVLGKKKTHLINSTELEVNIQVLLIKSLKTRV